MADPLEVLNAPELVNARNKHFARLESLRSQGKPNEPFFLWGYEGECKTDPYVDIEAWTYEVLEDLAAHAQYLLDNRVFRPLVVEFKVYGVHFVDRIFGAHVYELGKNNWQVVPLDRPVGTLESPDLESNETWVLAKRAAEAFLKAGVSVPLFGLPTIASALNIGINLCGQELLIAMYEHPAAAHKDLRTINNILCALHRWYLEHIPLDQLQPVITALRCQPPGYGQLCGCSTQLLSPELYKEFIAPLDAELLAVYPKGGMIHLCGAHAQHISTWREMSSLKTVQINHRAAEDLELYWNGLRQDQMFYVNPCPEMPVERILEITRGERTVIVADVLEKTAAPDQR
ncbi:MAG: hypothetical protein K6U00_02915 [Armatimonadetes bacterium]|nr:hypothetical protein [Armatimonadota bacterium]